MSNHLRGNRVPTSIVFFWPILVHDPTISLDVEVGPITTLVRKLSEVSHTPLQVEGAAANETVFLHVQNRPLSEVLQHLAKVTYSEWQSSPSGGQVLVRPQALVDFWTKAYQNDRQKRFDYWRQTIAVTPSQSSTLAEYMKECRAEENRDEAFHKRLVMIQNTFLSPLLSKCLSCVDPTPISRLQEGERLVFTLDPNQLQRKLPHEAGQAFDEFKRSLAPWQAELRKLKFKPNLEPVTSVLYRNQYAYADQATSWLPFESEASRILLTFEVSNDSLRVQMVLLDKKGRVVAWLPTPYSTDWRTKVNPISNLVESIASMHEIQPRVETRAFWTAHAAFVSLKQPVTNSEISRLLAPYFDDPVNHDFLNLGNQEFLDAVGPAIGRSVIACLPDQSALSWDQRDPKDYFRTLPSSERSQNLTENWLEIFPSEPFHHWNSRVDRQSATRFTREVRTGQPVRLATFASVLPQVRYYESAHLKSFLDYMNPDARNNNATGEWLANDFPGYRPLAISLTQDQWKTLHQGKTLEYSSLSNQQQQWCLDLLLSSPGAKYYGGRTPPGTPNLDPTFELANGLPHHLGITFESVDHEVWVAYDPENSREARPNHYIDFVDRPEIVAETGGLCGNYSRCNRSMLFEPRTWHRETLKFYLSPGHYHALDYYQPLSPDKGIRLKADQLSHRVLNRLRRDNPTFDLKR